jgi:hypothetical protein
MTSLTTVIRSTGPKSIKFGSVPIFLGGSESWVLNENLRNFLGFEIFTAMKIQVVASCIVTPYIEVIGYKPFGESCLLL